MWCRPSKHFGHFEVWGGEGGGQGPQLPHPPLTRAVLNLINLRRKERIRLRCVRILAKHQPISNRCGSSANGVCLLTINYRRFSNNRRPYIAFLPPEARGCRRCKTKTQSSMKALRSTHRPAPRSTGPLSHQWTPTTVRGQPWGPPFHCETCCVKKRVRPPLSSRAVRSSCNPWALHESRQ